MLYQFGKALFFVLIKLFGRLRVVGRPQVPRTGGVLVASNHVSYIDPPALGVASPRPIHFMAKAELFRVPILGPLIRRLGAFPVKRGTADRTALRTAHELLTAGKLVVVFFEGKRSPDGKLQSPELGAAMIALRAGVPIVPAALINTDHLLPRHGKRLHFSRVTVVFGEPLTFPQMAGKAGDRAALQEVSDIVASRIAALLQANGAAARVPEGYPQTIVEGTTHE